MIRFPKHHTGRENDSFTGKPCRPSCNGSLTHDILVSSWIDSDTSLLSAIAVTTLSSSFVLSSIVVVTICCSKRLRTTPHAIVTSLAVSDMLFAGLITAYTSRTLANPQTYNIDNIWERIYVFVASVSLILNYSNHLLISLERWLFIARPFLHSRIVSRRLTTCVLLSIWLIAVLSNLDVFVQENVTTYSSSSAIRSSIVFAAIHFLVSIILFIIYAHITVITRRQAQAIQRARVAGEANERETSLASLRKAWRSVRMFCMVFGSFFLFVSPMVCLHLYSFVAHRQLELLPNHVYSIVVLLAFGQYIANFFVYANQDKEFRGVLKKYILKLTGSACSKRVYPENSGSARARSSHNTICK